MTKKRTTLILFAVIIPLCAIILAFLTFFALFPRKQREDFRQLSSREYDSLFLSMFPIDEFQEEDFAYWRNYNLLKSSYCIPDFSALKSYLNKAAKSGNIISTIYLGVLPEKLDAGKLNALLQTYPGVHFEILLPYPSIDYWLQLSQEEYQHKLQAYHDFTAPLLTEGNISVYFFGASEWLIANPLNYQEPFWVKEEIAETILLNADRSHSYLLTAENATQSIDALTILREKYLAQPTKYADLSEYNVVFFGDSIIGNFTGNTSIPGVVEGLCGARVYNLGIGGSTASKGKDNNASIPDLAVAFTQKDLSAFPADTQGYLGMEAYLADTPEEKYCFVINYGLNDYFVGAPVTSQDSSDIYSYIGAIRAAVHTLQEAYPDAVILLNTPNFTTLFDNGTEPHGNGNYRLRDYADALCQLAEELQVGLLDNHQSLGINAKNHQLFLSDGCHPNEAGRFLMGQNIAQKLGEIVQKQ